MSSGKKSPSADGLPLGDASRGLASSFVSVEGGARSLGIRAGQLVAAVKELSLPMFFIGQGGRRQRALALEDFENLAQAILAGRVAGLQAHLPRGGLALQAARESDEETLSGMRLDLGLARSQLAEQHTALTGLRGELEAARGEHDVDRRELAVCREEIAELKSEVESLRSEGESDARALSELWTVLDRTKEELAEAHGARQSVARELEASRGETAEARAAGEDLRDELAGRQETIEALGQELAKARAEQASTRVELGEVRQALERRGEELEEARRENERTQRELALVQSAYQNQLRAFQASQDRFVAATRELEVLREEGEATAERLAEQGAQVEATWRELRESQAGHARTRAELEELQQVHRQLVEEHERNQPLEELALKQAELKRALDGVREAEASHERTRQELTIVQAAYQEQLRCLSRARETSDAPPAEPADELGRLRAELEHTQGRLRVSEVKRDSIIRHLRRVKSELRKGREEPGSPQARSDAG